MSNKFLKHIGFLSILVAISISFGISNIVLGQETRGIVRGTITDPNGAPITGAKVTVTDTARGTSVSISTNGDGFYQVNYLLSGKYKVTVDAGGFKKLVRENVLVEIGNTIQVDMPLEIGGSTETVTVTTEIQPLNTESGSISQTIDAKRINELPLVHGDPYTLIGTSTGVAHTGSQRLDRPFEPTHIVGYAVDGTRGNRSDLTIDGAPSTSTANGNEVIASYVPPTDIVQEFKVQTATFDAQFGNTEGGVTSISIKSGTNNLHGSSYFIAEPGNMAANDTFGKARGTARPDTKSNRFGGSIHGPIFIPKLFNGKDKSFFLFGYEGIRDSRPRFDTANPWTPTEAMRRGDFSALGITIYDPLTRVNTGTAASPIWTGTAFAGNIIPTNRISPVATALLKFYSLPKTSPLAGSRLTGNLNDSTLAEKTQPYNNYTGRIDHNFSGANRAFIRGSWYDRNSNYNDYVGSQASGVTFIFASRQLVADDVHVINASTVINFKYGYNRFIRQQDQDPDARGFDLTALGFNSSYNSLVPAALRRFPRFDFSGGLLGTGFGNEFRPTTTHSPSVTLNKTFSRHSMKFGAELRIYREDSVFSSNDQTGQFIFDNQYTRQASNLGTDTEGIQGFAAFLLGLPSTAQIVRRADYSEYSKTDGFFIQDDWKITKRLTLNLGVRYEWETPLIERNNKSVAGFDPNYVQQALQDTARARLTATPVTGYDGTAINPATFNVRGGLIFAGANGNSNLYKTPKDTILPRFGFAYQWNDKTVIRGGAGMFAGFLGERRGDVIQPGYTRTTTVGLSSIASGAPIPQNIANFSSVAILEPVGSGQGFQTGLGTGISFFNQNPKVSKQVRYQIGFQRELPLGFYLDASYVGNYGFNIEIARNINALPNQFLNRDNSRSAAQIANNTILGAQIANPFAGQIAGTNFNNATIGRSQLLRPFAAFGDITTTVNDGKSWYNSIQATLTKRLSQGFTIQGSYTFSKWIQATEYLNAGDAKPTKIIGDQDVPHRLSITSMYELPFGKGARFLSDAGGVANALIGGWQVQGVYGYQTGFPISFGNDLFYNGGNVRLNSNNTAIWFNRSAFNSFHDFPKFLTVSNPTQAQINTAVAAAVQAATPLSHLRTLPFRFSNVRRDSINNIDLSLLKNFRIGETMKIQFRLEYINAFNQPYLPAPLTGATAVTFGSVSASNLDNYARRGQIGLKFLF